MLNNKNYKYNMETLFKISMPHKNFYEALTLICAFIYLTLINGVVPFPSMYCGNFPSHFCTAS